MVSNVSNAQYWLEKCLSFCNTPAFVMIMFVLQITHSHGMKYLALLLLTIAPRINPHVSSMV